MFKHIKTGEKKAANIKIKVLKTLFNIQLSHN